MKRRAVVVAVTLVVIACSAAALLGQRRGGRFGTFLRRPAADTFDGRFNFCRIGFNNGYRDGGGWSVDYPRADVNLSIRLSELTKAPVSFNDSGEPKHVVIGLTEDALFRCPFIMMTEVGGVLLRRCGSGKAANVPAQRRVPVGR